MKDLLENALNKAVCGRKLCDVVFAYSFKELGKLAADLAESAGVQLDASACYG